MYKKYPIIIIGSDHRHLSVEERERLYLSAEKYERTGMMINQLLGVHEFMILNNKFYVGRALDNRIGGFVIAEVARLLHQNKINLPYVIFIGCGNDGTGAARDIRRIANGYPLREVSEPLICKGALEDSHLVACKELGLTMAMGLEMGIF